MTGKATGMALGPQAGNRQALSKKAPTVMQLLD